MPGGPINSTPLGIRPPSFWNFCGSLRNSTISESSSFASSIPATSLNVTFLPLAFSSLALLLPKESARLPPLCIWRMKNTQRPMIRSSGPQVINTMESVFSRSSSASIRTSCSSSRSARPGKGMSWVLKLPSPTLSRGAFL